MADPTLFEQTSILKDIREELRTTRMDQRTGGALPARPSQAFFQAQATADRMLSGQWGSMGWASAYQGQIHSSLANDIMGSMGLRAAPQTMWQNEFETASRSLLSDRLANAPFALIAPGFASRSRRMGDEMFAYSGRFNRSGDLGRSSIGAMRSMARDLQIEAAGDMRLSGKDYESVMSEGLKSGQFDFTKGGSELMSTFRELRDATADLTKSLRVGASEVGQVMGAFRQAGVVDIADQRRMAERLGATSRVAGLSVPEMSGMVSGAISAGLPMGISAETSANLIQNSVMQLRSASREGLISQGVMAAGGGVQGIAGAQAGAIQRFMASPAGFYSMVGSAGGAGGGMMNRLMGGIGATGGTMGGMAAFEANKTDLMARLGPQMGEIAYNQFMRQQLKYMGVADGTPNAVNQVFMMARGQMGDAAALAYARLNHSEEGKQARLRTAYLAESEGITQLRESEYQRHFENESFSGQFRQVMGGIDQLPGRAARWLGNKLSPGQSGFLGMGGQFDADVTRAAMLGGGGSVGFDAIMAAGRGGSRGGDIVIEGMRRDWGANAFAGGVGVAGGIAGGFGGWSVGSAVGAGLGMLTGPGAPVMVPLLATLGGIAGGSAGTFGGFQGGVALGTSLTGGGGRTVLSGSAAAEYSQILEASRSLTMSTGQSTAAFGRLAGSQAFRTAASKFTSGELYGADADEFRRLMVQSASDSNISVAEATQAFISQGGDVKLAGTYRVGEGTSSYTDTLKKVLGGASTGAVFASSRGAKAMSTMALGLSSGQESLVFQAKRDLRGLGAGADDIASVISATKGLGASGMAAFYRDSLSAEKGFAGMEVGKVAEVGLALGRRAAGMITDDSVRGKIMSSMGANGEDFINGLLGDKYGELTDSGLGILGETFSRVKELGHLDLSSASGKERAIAISGVSKDQIDGYMKTRGSSEVIRGLAFATLQRGEKVANSPNALAAESMKTAAEILRKIATDLKLTK